jgi:hypothetical protein
MKTLVIHPKDQTTDFLSTIYQDKDWTLITNNTSKKYLKEQIKSHDRIIMLGHGTENGLLGFDKFVIDSTWVYLLREKHCICIWCNANLFVDKYDLKGFHTGMIISEYEEALMFSIPTNSFFLNESNTDFAHAIKHSIDSSDMLNSVISLYDGNSAVVIFNKQNLYFKS